MKTTSKLLFLFSITALLLACGSESNPSEDSDIKNQKVVKDAVFYGFGVATGVLEDVIFDAQIITDMVVSNIDCDVSSAGLICEELTNRIEEGGLLFSLKGTEWAEKAMDSDPKDGVLNVKGNVHLGGPDIIPAQWNYSFNEEGQSFSGELIFLLNDIKIVMYIKGRV